MSEGRALVCGFSDLASGIAGLAWELGDERGGLLAREGEVAAATAGVDDPDGEPVLTLEAGELSCEAKLTAVGEPVELRDAAGRKPPGAPRSALCRARVRLSGGIDRKLACAGHLTRWRSDPVEGAELLRHLAIPAPDGGLLLATARREPGAEGHDSEHASAWLLDPEGEASPFGEALLSTQYDDSGRQTRAGLELWSQGDDAHPMRAAGTVLGAATNGGGVAAALLRSSAEGDAGLGGYLIWRAS